MKYFTLPSMLLASILLMTGCDQGPAEEFGEEVDDVVSNVEDKATEVGNAIEDKCEEIKAEAGAEDSDC
ncbi:hypothetical protein NBRC116494_24770 [Aurantivibrio plasticivorans]